MNPYEARQARKFDLASKMGMKSEKKVAKRLGAKLTPASGAMETEKGDMVLRDACPMAGFRVEAKATSLGSYSLKLDTLAKILREANDRQQFPALSVSFTRPDGSPLENGAWMVMEEKIFKLLLSYAKACT